MVVKISPEDGGNDTITVFRSGICAHEIYMRSKKQVESGYILSSLIPFFI